MTGSGGSIPPALAAQRVTYRSLLEHIIASVEHEYEQKYERVDDSDGDPVGGPSVPACVWWPDIDQGSTSAEHSRFFNPTKRDVEMEAYQRLAAEFHVPEHPELTVEQRLHVLIALEWAQAQSSPTDRHNHPLGHYIFGRQLVESVRRKPAGVSIERIARVCAMVACRRAAQTGSEPHPLRRNPSPTASQWERADGATAWRCALKGSAGGPRLHYWQLRDGTIEFASVAAHDDFSIPGG